MPYRSLLYRTASALGLAVSVGAGAAHAQAPSSATQTLQEVVVTGSRIARRDYVAQSPIVTTDISAIQSAGTPTLDAFLTQLPQFQPGTGGFTNQTGGADVGQATLNLRGLGSQRNLVLLDGRRAQPSNAQGVIDLNTIPQSALSGVEVISGGASATYGSDAMAGVVNFKLRQRFTGFEADVQIGRAERGDADARQVSFVAGDRFLGDRLSAVVSAEYSERGLVSTNSRPFFAVGQATSSLPQGYYVPDGSNLPTQAAVNGVFAGYGVNAGVVSRTSNFGFNTDGTLFKNGTPDANYRGSTAQPMMITSAGGVAYNGGYYNWIQVPLKRYSVYSHLEYDVNDQVRLYGQLIYSTTNAKAQGSPGTIGGPWSLTIPITNPFIPAALKTLLASRPNPNAAFTYNGRMWATGPRAFDNDSTTYQLTVGATGSIAFLNSHYDLYFEHGATHERTQGVSGMGSTAAEQSLINAPDGGKSICAGGYNPFGLQPLSTACQTYIGRRPVSLTDVGQDRVEGTLSGDLAKLPAGELKYSVNADYQKNTYVYNPDPLFVINDISSVTATQYTTGNTSVAEVSLELLVPLLANAPLVKSLNFTPGYRYTNNNLFGGISTYKADFDWKVIEPLLIRGGYQRAVRAPNIGELFLAGTSAIAAIGAPPSGGDPCDVRSALRSGPAGAQVRNLCLATGLNPGIVDNYTTFTASIVAQTAGNKALKPETADTFTIGAVLRPTEGPALLRNMSLSIDYYNISIEGAIASLSAQTSLNKCFNADGSNPTYSATNSYCAFFTRDPTSGVIIQAFQPFLNLGAYKTSGIDTQFDWRVDLRDMGLKLDSSIRASLGVNYLNSFKIQNFTNQPFQEFANTIAAGASYPRWKTLASLTYSQAGVDVGLRWRHISAMEDSTSVTAPANAAPGVKNYDYYDLVGSANFGRRWQVRAGITNLMDKQPAMVAGQPTSTNAGVYDVIGRSYYLGLKMRF